MSAAAARSEEAAAEEGALWRAMRGDPSGDARGRLFALHLPFAKSLAGRQFRTRRGGDVEYGDFVQLACAGLLEAMDRYDPELGVPFRAFAARRINGSISDGLATMSEVREQIRYRSRVKNERLRSLAVADAAKGTPAETMEALIDMAVGLALGFMLEGTNLYQDEQGAAETQPTAYDSLAWKDLVQRLVAELRLLPERDRTILELHYLEDVHFDQIALLLGLSKGRISQLHKAAMILLRKRIAGAGGFRLER
jgi:RNA polymerase sigma factor for flagellar operon FliA